MCVLEQTVNDIYAHIRISEGFSRLQSFLLYIYRHPGVSVKELARYLKLPIPLVSAIKNECKKHGMVIPSNGMRLSDDGVRYVRECMHYGAVNMEKLNAVLAAPELPLEMFTHETEALAAIYQNRPTVDVTVDQSLCTAETGIKRALLMLRTSGLIGKHVLLAGDDDLTSIAMGLVLRALSAESDPDMAAFTVIDTDSRILDYIGQTAPHTGVCIHTVRHDLRLPLPDEHLNRYDAVFTDPPYTLAGLTLFVSRGAQALKSETDLSLYLSCARRDPLTRLAVQRMWCEAGLVVDRVYENFNHYHGAQILGGVSDLTVLMSTAETKPVIAEAFDAPIYTNEMNRSTRVYRCKNCHAEYHVGYSEKIATVERLKETGCTSCGGLTFILRERNAGQREASS